MCSQDARYNLNAVISLLQRSQAYVVFESSCIRELTLNSHWTLVARSDSDNIHPPLRYQTWEIHRLKPYPLTHFAGIITQNLTTTSHHPHYNCPNHLHIAGAGQRVLHDRALMAKNRPRPHTPRPPRRQQAWRQSDPLEEVKYLLLVYIIYVWLAMSLI